MRVCSRQRRKRKAERPRNETEGEGGIYKAHIHTRTDAHIHASLSGKGGGSKEGLSKRQKNEKREPSWAECQIIEREGAEEKGMTRGRHGERQPRDARVSTPLPY